MIKANYTYQHQYLGHKVRVTELAEQWVEFINLDSDQIAWLELVVFERAYGQGQAATTSQTDLVARRAQARAMGLLVPQEFLPLDQPQTRY